MSRIKKTSAGFHPRSPCIPETGGGSHACFWKSARRKEIQKIPTYSAKSAISATTFPFPFSPFQSTYRLNWSLECNHKRGLTDPPS